MPGWMKPTKVLRNSPVADPVTRAAKNTTDSVDRYKRSRGKKEQAAMAKDIDAFRKAKSDTRYAPKGYGRGN